MSGPVTSCTVGWADVATRHDLASLEERIDLRFARVDDRFNAMEDRITAAASDLRVTFEHELRSQSTAFGHELRSQSTTMVLGLVSVVLTMAALAFAMVSFA